MNYKHLNVYKDGILGIIQIDRPEVKNVLSDETVMELQHALQKWEQHEGVEFILFKGTGNEAFISGVEAASLDDESRQEVNVSNLTAFCQALEMSNKVTIAAINGFALDVGFEVAMACDIRIASESAVFGLPEMNASLLPRTSVAHRLTKLVGRSVALNFILTGELMDASRAYQLGIVADLTTDEELWEKVLHKIQMIRRKGPLAIQLAKLVASESQNTPLQNGFALEKLMHTLSLTANSTQHHREVPEEKHRLYY